MNIAGIPLAELINLSILLWVVTSSIWLITKTVKYLQAYKERRNYTVGMFATNQFNSNLRKVEELSVLQLLMKYYRKSAYYIEIVDKRKLHIVVLKESEHQKTNCEVESYMREQLRNGSKLRVLSTTDKSFFITAFHNKKYYC